MDTFGYLGSHDHTDLCAHMYAHILVLVGTPSLCKAFLNRDLGIHDYELGTHPVGLIPRHYVVITR